MTKATNPLHTPVWSPQQFPLDAESGSPSPDSPSVADVLDDLQLRTGTSSFVGPAPAAVFSGTNQTSEKQRGDNSDANQHSSETIQQLYGD